LFNYSLAYLLTYQ